ncbi:MAG: hypothetical protein H8E18_00095 [FCB group bacterium]|nr:hypothetical protein [FCB group bacterium]
MFLKPLAIEVLNNYIHTWSSSVYGNNEKSPFAETDTEDHLVSLYTATA